MSPKPKCDIRRMIDRRMCVRTDCSILEILPGSLVKASFEQRRRASGGVREMYISYIAGILVVHAIEGLSTGTSMP